MSMSGHPAFEELSAFHDGEAPGLAAHVAACAECHTRMAELAALSEAVAERPVQTPSGRERAIAAALAEAGHPTAAPGPERPYGAGGTGPERPYGAGGTGPERPVRAGGTGPERRRGWQWVAVASVAATMMVALGTVALLRGEDRTSDRAVTQSTPTSGAEANAGGAGRAGPGDIDSAVLGGELGEVTDAAALAAKVAPALQAATGVADSPETSSDSAALAAPPRDAAQVVGTRPCEIELREGPSGLSERGAQGPSGLSERGAQGPSGLTEWGAQGPSGLSERGAQGVRELGPVVYLASATTGGAPVVVLGFARTDGSGVILYAMERDGCRLLFSSPL